MPGVSSSRDRMESHDRAARAARYLAWQGSGRWVWDDDQGVWTSRADPNEWKLERPIFLLDSHGLARLAEQEEGPERFDSWIACGELTPERYTDAFNRVGLSRGAA